MADAVRTADRAEPERVVVWSPQPGPQTALCTCPAQDIFYGGARGGGKTDGVLGRFIGHAGRYGKHAKGILFRRTYPELEGAEGVIERSQEIYEPLGWSYNAGKYTWTAPNGATMRFRHLERNEHANKYKGHAYTYMVFEELTHWPGPEPIDQLWGAIRSAHGVPCVRISTGNPGGPGHMWVKERYIEGRPGFEPFRWRPQPELRPDLWIESVFIPAKLDDNLMLQQNDPRYEDRLAMVGGEALYKGWRFGDWNVAVGAAFQEWSSDLHVAEHYPERDASAPYAWVVWGDWGYEAQGCLYLAAVGPERVFVRWEYLFRKTPPYDVGYDFGQKVQRFPRPEYVSLDEPPVPDGGPTIIERFAKGMKDAISGDSNEGTSIVPPVIQPPRGKGSRAAGKQLVHEHLRWEGEDPAAVKPWQMPKMQFHPGCKYAIRTIPALPLAKNNPEDVDTDGADHAYDAIKGGLLCRTPGVFREDERRPVPRGRHPGFKNGARRPRYGGDDEPVQPGRFQRPPARVR